MCKFDTQANSITIASDQQSQQNTGASHSVTDLPQSSDAEPDNVEISQEIISTAQKSIICHILRKKIRTKVSFFVRTD